MNLSKRPTGKKTECGSDQPTKLTTKPNKSTIDFKLMVTNADQLTSSKKEESRKRVKKEKPLIIVICKVKFKNKIII